MGDEAKGMTAVPGGAHTYSKLRFPGPVRRAIDGDDCWIQCDDRREYLDTVAGLGTISLGYQNREVDVAIMRQVRKGISFSLPTELEEDTAQHLLRFLDWGERVRFSKNGADVTNLAVRLARAHTGEDIIVAHDYHGHDDWCQVGANDKTAGIPCQLNELVRNPWDIDKQTGVAAIILEPVPSNGDTRTVAKLNGIAEWAKEHGALLIYDCIITGMRLNKRGWPEDAPEPDLACYGKAMGNGMPLAACVGSAELMDRITEDVFFSTTFGGECLSLAAAQAALTVYEEQNVLGRFKVSGQRLNKALKAYATDSHIEDQLEIVGYPGRPFHKWRTEDQSRVFTEAMVDQGILYQGYHNLMLATCHDEPLKVIERAYEVAIQAVAAI